MAKAESDELRDNLAAFAVYVLEAMERETSWGADLLECIAQEAAGQSFSSSDMHLMFKSNVRIVNGEFELLPDFTDRQPFSSGDHTHASSV